MSFENVFANLYEKTILPPSFLLFLQIKQKSKDL